MKLDNILDFTENHRFYVFRDFSISPLDDKVLSFIYQPMIGAGAYSLYRLLLSQLPADQLGYSELEQQRKLFLSLGVDPGDKGRRSVALFTSRLEAVGLLHTVRKLRPDQEEAIYFYRLLRPLNPYEFFKNQHLTLLLRDRIGKHAVLHLYDQLCASEPSGWSDESVTEVALTVPFYDLFELNTHVIDHELEQALVEAAPTQLQDEWAMQGQMDGFTASEILMQFPRLSQNRGYVEELEQHPEQLQTINYVAGKYRLTLQEMCRLLDEDHVFAADGELDVDRLQHLASLLFIQSKKREEDRDLKLQRERRKRAVKEEKSVSEAFMLEVPSFLKDQCDATQYNMFLRNRSYIDVLERFFPGKVPESTIKNFSRIDLEYKLEEEVINVLIHFLKVHNLSWSRNYVEQIAADMLAKEVRTYEQAITHMQSRLNYKKETAGDSNKRRSGKRSTQTSSKPKLPIYKESTDSTVSDEEYEEILRKIRARSGKS